MRLPRPLRPAAALLTAFAAVVGSVTAATASAAEPFPVGFVHEQVDVPADQLPSSAATGTRLVYLTRNQGGEKTMASGVFWTPHGSPPAGGWPVVSWAHGTTGIADDCAPSRTRHGDNLEAPVRAALEAGYAVTATDYAGLGSADETEYLGGWAAAHSIIDMIRAARSVDRSLSARWVSIGHSQGGHAALFAAARGPEYAPELPVQGVVALAPVSSMDRVFGVFGPAMPSLGRYNGISAPFLYILAGLDHAHRDLDVAEHLTDRGRRYLDLARDQCNGELSESLRSVSPGSLVDSAFTRDADFIEALRRYAEVPDGGYTVPVRIHHGMLDPVLPYPLSMSLRTRMREAGTEVSLRGYRADHTTVVDRSLADTMAAIEADFARD